MAPWKGNPRLLPDSSAEIQCVSLFPPLVSFPSLILLFVVRRRTDDIRQIQHDIQLIEQEKAQVGNEASRLQEQYKQGEVRFSSHFFPSPIPDRFFISVNTTVRRYRSSDAHAQPQQNHR
jgi:hypothetical protein